MPRNVGQTSDWKAHMGGEALLAGSGLKSNVLSIY